MSFIDFLPAISEIYLIICTLVLLLLGVFGLGHQLKRITSISLTALVGTILLIVLSPPQGSVVIFNGLFTVDNFVVMMKAITVVAALVSLLLTMDQVSNENDPTFFIPWEYPVLLLFSTLGMMVMISANDFMSVYIGLELHSLPLYVMAAIQRENLKSTEAGIKYFILGAVASGLLLYGISLTYGFAGSTNFDALEKLFASQQIISIGTLVGLVFILCGLAFKVAAVPFHMWSPDVYEGTPTTVTSFIASAPKIAAIAVILRIFYGPYHYLAAQWQLIVIVIAVFSMFVGAFGALQQKNIKRLLAYSSVSHIGYALVGIAAANHFGLQAVIIYMTLYVVSALGIFAALLTLRKSGKGITNISEFAGLSKTHPFSAVCMAIFMFSMAGIPPLAGFFGKFYVFMSAVQSSLYFLAVIGVLASVIGAYYYLRIIKIMYFDTTEASLDHMREGTTSKVIMTICGITLLTFFIASDWLLSLSAGAAETLLTSIP